MQDNLTTPYKKAREIAKSKNPKTRDLYSQEKTAEALGVSPGTIKNWEDENCTCSPTDTDVEAMALYLEAPWLPYEHLVYQSSCARKYLPNINHRTLPAAALGLLKALNEFEKLRNDFIDIVSDEKISEDEISKFEATTKSLDNIITAIYAVKCAETKEQEK